MEFRSLQYFLMVAREENITKAANLLHLTQPTLSRSIMQLEEELGVKLFIRSNHNIILTEDGMLLKRRAQELVSLAEKTKQDFQRGDVQLTGEISIGSGEFRSTRYLSKMIASFREKHPLVRYQIYSGNSENIKERIERGILDFGLMMEPIDISKYEYISMPAKEKWGILVSELSELSQKETIQATDLQNQQLISARSEKMYPEIRKWFGEYYDQVEVIASGNLLYNEAILAQEQIGAVLGIELDCNYPGLKFVPLSPSVETPTVLTWKKNQILSSTTIAFIEHTTSYIKSISGN
ncbi:LysR family transcriptional regulator [Oscillospiraceae bacterium BX1]|uniref:LysR family transcriptional regulator n=2 Tax=Yanshouia hominis TaxID=2763673 RepID=A0ABR7NMI3_9FIRM|nr:LysR family transcriptional regulator [Yanshouia hominis]MBC8577622.1 LysR family transcriptional regulator [Yanshouia hominis]